MVKAIKSKRIQANRKTSRNIRPQRNDIRIRSGKTEKYDGRFWRRMCDTCKSKRASYGSPIDVSATLCSSCSKKQHGKNRTEFTKKCKICKQKHPSFGGPGDIFPTLCHSCANQKYGSDKVDFNKRCEICNQKQPSFGGPDDIAPVLCNSCSKKKYGSNRRDFHKKCFTCGEKTAKYGGPEDLVATLCGTCSKKKYGDERRIFQKKCKNCGVKRANYGGPEDIVPLFCGDCSKQKYGEKRTDFIKKCEMCMNKCPKFGGPNDVVPSLCDNCSYKKYGNNRSNFSKKCQICREKSATFGGPEDLVATLCGNCSKQKFGAQRKSFQRKCKLCPSFANRDGFCTVHHPNYIPSMPRFSKSACELIDLCEKFFNIKLNHRHYDQNTKSLEGRETMPIVGRQFACDGYCELTENQIKSFPLILRHAKIDVEFQGNLWHGHPYMWHDLSEDDQKKHPLYKKWLQDLEKWQLFDEAGIQVFYVLEKDWLIWKKSRDRNTFDGLFYDSGNHIR